MLKRVCGVVVAGVAAAAGAQTDFPTIFLVHNVSDSVVAYRVEGDGTPTQVGYVDVSDWPTDIAVSPDGSRLALTHATSNSVEVLTIIAVASDGGLTKMAEFSIPDSPLAVDWIGDDVVAVASSVFGNSSFRTYRYSEDPSPTLSLLDTETPGGFLTALEPSSLAGLGLGGPQGQGALAYRARDPGQPLLGGDDHHRTWYRARAGF